ncbi:MAG: alpha/beta fold hydrolase [Polyangia bacterium]
MSNERAVDLWCDGTRISGLFGVPEGAGSFPAVVFCVGFSLVKEVWLLDFARHLRRSGFATLNIDYRTFGESGGERRCRLSPRMQVQDVRAGLDFLQAQQSVDPTRLGVFGVSLGATIAAGTAAVDRRVRGGVIVAGPGDLERVWSAMPNFEGFRDKVLAARRRYTTTGEVTYVPVPKLLSSDPETVALLIEEQKRHPRWRLEVTFESLADLFEFSAERGLERSRGLLFIHPAGDELIACAESESMYAVAGEPKRYVALDGLRHAELYGQGRGFARVAEHATTWLSAQLR